MIVKINFLIAITITSLQLVVVLLAYPEYFSWVVPFLLLFVPLVIVLFKFKFDFKLLYKALSTKKLWTILVLSFVISFFRQQNLYGLNVFYLFSYLNYSG